jgi:putative redox protein
MAELSVSVAQKGPSTSEGTARQHKVTVDRSAAHGGSDEGPMGGELFLLGLGGCFMSNLLAAIRARSTDVTDARVVVTAQVDGTPPRFVAFTLSVSAQCKDQEELRKLVLIAERGCIVANSLKAHMPVTVQVV